MSTSAITSLRSMDVNRLLTDGFVTIPYPRDLRAAVRSAMRSWQAFCKLPLEQKQLLSSDEEDRVKDFGYMKREDKGANADNKELFHALRKNYSLLLPKARALVDQVGDGRAVQFISACNLLIATMAPFIRRFAIEVEEQFDLRGFTAEVMGAQDNWTFRYLRYPKGQPILANPHADRGGFTFHLDESEGGGEYLDFDGNWRQWPVSEEQTIIFPSMGLQYRSRGVLKALWHRVLPTESAAAERYSMVAFIDFSMSHRFDDSRHRLQNFDPGFNYTMKHRDFANLFVPAHGLAQTD